MISFGNRFGWTGDKFLCIMQKEKENEPSIYRMDLNGKKREAAGETRAHASVSAP